MKQEFENNIDELFGSFLKDYEDTPSQKTKNKILTDIRKTSIVKKTSFYNKYKKVIFSGIAAALLISSFSVYHNYFAKNNNQKTIDHPTVNNDKSFTQQIKQNTNKDSIYKPTTIQKNKIEIHSNIISNDTLKQKINNQLKNNIQKAGATTQKIEKSTLSRLDTNKNIKPSINSYKEKNTATKKEIAAIQPEKQAIKIEMKQPKDSIKPDNQIVIEQKVAEPKKEILSIPEIKPAPIISNKIEEPINKPDFTFKDSSKSTRKTDTIPTEQAKQEQQKSALDKLTQYSKTNQWILGLSYNPEMLYGIKKDQIPSYNNSKYINSFCLNIKYNMDGIIISSGLGLGFYKKDISSIIYYKSDVSSDLKNSMISSDTIVDPQSGKKIVTNDMLNVNDASLNSNYLNSISSQVTHLKYTYLQIPLMIGYQKPIGKLFYTFNIGGIYSMLLSKKEPVAITNDYQLINIDNTTSLQIENSWIFECSAGIGYHFNKLIYSSVEPVFRYYCGSLNKNNEVEIKHPYSLGLKAGIYFKL